MAIEHTTQRRFLVENRGVQPLTFKAVLNQEGSANLVNITGFDAIDRGVTYYIVANPKNEDLTSIGATSNEVGTAFVSNGDYFNLFSEDVTLRLNTGAPILRILENTLGFTPYCVQSDTGNYSLRCAGVEFENYRVNDTPVIVKINESGATVANNLSSVRGAFSYEEAIVNILSYLNEGNILEDNLLNDSDNFFRTSIEIEVYI